MSIHTERKKLIIGLFGFGVVGEGLYQVLQRTPGLNASIKKVCIKHPLKQRNAPSNLFTTDPEVLLQDEEINVIVELTNDTEGAFYIITTALKNRKAVVSANKKVIAEHQQELLSLQQQYSVPLLYEAAACASIPVIRNLEEYYDNDLLQSISGIINGSTNYILTKVLEERISFADALAQAQAEGFAESDPSLDVNGIDAVNKLAILLTHTYGIVNKPDELVFSGIQALHEKDAQYAHEKRYQIKLVAQAAKLDDGKVAAFVLPQFITSDSQLYNVKNENNGVIIESSFADKQFFYGKGAGSFPTASAVLSDISALRYNYKYEYKKLYQNIGCSIADDFLLRVYVSFDSLIQVPHSLFETVESWSSSQERCFITGQIHFSRLKKSDWWKRPGVSLILQPEGIVSGHKTLKEKQEVEFREYEEALV